MNAIVQRILADRGIAGDAALEKFFNPVLADLARPETLPGSQAAAAAILAAVRANRRIVVFGDYDCDGVCATAIMCRAIAAVGGDVSPFLPERLTEGYGMTAASVERMLKENPEVSLVVTVDNGINSIDEVAALKDRGIETIVTDHHLPGEELPAASVVVNPKVAAPDEVAALCGAGVAFLIANAIVDLARREGVYAGPNIGGPLLVMAGLATVTDVMPVINQQNRILVTSALRNFRRLAPIGLKELLDRAAKAASAAMTSRDFGFLIGPRINASGRLGNGMDALELMLLSDDKREMAREYALHVDLQNTERKNIEAAMYKKAEEQVVPGADAQVVNLPEGHQGVVGIVAARILERLERKVPVVVIVKNHGSARAPEGYNVRDAFIGASAALTRFGGHAAAGGCSVAEGKIELFRELFTKACSAQGAASGIGDGSACRFDAEVVPGDITLELAQEVARMEPFGEGNAEPVFLIRGAVLGEIRPLGGEGRHLAVSFRGGIPRAVWWGAGERLEELRRQAANPVDIYFSVDVSNYGEPHPELRLREVKSEK